MKRDRRHLRRQARDMYLKTAVSNGSSNKSWCHVKKVWPHGYTLNEKINERGVSPLHRQLDWWTGWITPHMFC